MKWALRDERHAVSECGRYVITKWHHGGIPSYLLTFDGELLGDWHDSSKSAQHAAEKHKGAA